MLSILFVNTIKDSLFKNFWLYLNIDNIFIYFVIKILKTIKYQSIEYSQLFFNFIKLDFYSYNPIFK